MTGCEVPSSAKVMNVERFTQRLSERIAVFLHLVLKMGIVGSQPRPTVLFPALAALSVSQPLRTSSGVIDCRIPRWPVVPGVATKAASKGIRILVKPNSSQNDH